MKIGWFQRQRKKKERFELEQLDRTIAGLREIKTDLNAFTERVRLVRETEQQRDLKWVTALSMAALNIPRAAARVEVPLKPDEGLMRKFFEQLMIPAPRMPSHVPRSDELRAACELALLYHSRDSSEGEKRVKWRELLLMIYHDVNWIHADATVEVLCEAIREALR